MNLKIINQYNKNNISIMVVVVLLQIVANLNKKKHFIKKVGIGGRPANNNKPVTNKVVDILLILFLVLYSNLNKIVNIINDKV